MTQEKLDAEIRRWEQRMEEAKDRIRVLKASAAGSETGRDDPPERPEQ